MRLGTALMTGLLRAGIPMGPLVLLSVPGRKSGKVFTTPVALVQHGNERWLVAAFGEVNWVRNLRAAGMAQFTRGWHTEAIGVAELEAQEAAPILKQYLKASQRVSFIKPYFHVTPHSSLADFVQAAAHHPVFRVVRKDVME
jgi:deazaflavin-dependent oxidoreductase (nitroreductase family)